ncbi:probable carboxylesterase 12 [Rhodamnia argentea]|uniref:Probable carboxylesterase 12 n=1 Tax=Rhodamnia argentea TaxID=178133 RepID=A0A8B8PVL8_9MYRT|nr:probable carboxylesterase 12 [Rhodamnia argentea]
MESEMLYDLSPVVRLYKDGRVERLEGTEIVPPSLDEKTGVQSKDVVISSDSAVSARLYIPKAAICSLRKLPILVYYHGGGFIVQTAWSPAYHNYLNALVAEANVIAVSINYRKAPEAPLPAAYDDSWTALKWVASHSAGNGPEEWLNSHANLKKVFLAGDSAGANIINNMGIRFGEEKLSGIEVPGVMMVHPYFWGNEPLPSETTDPMKRSFAVMFWHAASPATTGCDDPLINPAMDPRLSGLSWKKVLVCVAGKDMLRHRGWYYKEILSKSGWSGVVEEMESPGEDHDFHLFNPNCDNAVKLMKRLVCFMNEVK